MFYGDDVCKANLKRQLQTFALDYPNQSTPPSIFDIKDYMKSLSPAKKQLIAEVCTVLKLIRVMPASNATSEHTFSALRRVKTYILIMSASNATSEHTFSALQESRPTYLLCLLPMQRVSTHLVPYKESRPTYLLCLLPMQRVSTHLVPYKSQDLHTCYVCFQCNE